MLDKKQKSEKGKCSTVFTSDIEINNNNSSTAPHNTQRNKIDKESENKVPQVTFSPGTYKRDSGAVRNLLLSNLTLTMLRAVMHVKKQIISFSYTSSHKIK